MTDVKIITQSRNLLDNEFLFREGFNFNNDHRTTSEILEWIEKNADIKFEWISRNELEGGSYHETAGLRIIKKGNHNV
jgi:hypothetical protein